MFTKRLQYINFLMNLYRDMIGKNENHEIEQEKQKELYKKENWHTKYFYKDVPPYSDTMLHSIITIINKLNNNEI